MSANLNFRAPRMVSVVLLTSTDGYKQTKLQTQSIENNTVISLEHGSDGAKTGVACEMVRLRRQLRTSSHCVSSGDFTQKQTTADFSQLRRQPSPVDVSWRVSGIISAPGLAEH